MRRVLQLSPLLRLSLFVAVASVLAAVAHAGHPDGQAEPRQQWERRDPERMLHTKNDEPKVKKRKKDERGRSTSAAIPFPQDISQLAKGEKGGESERESICASGSIHLGYGRGKERMAFRLIGRKRDSFFPLGSRKSRVIFALLPNSKAILSDKTLRSTQGRAKEDFFIRGVLSRG